MLYTALSLIIKKSVFMSNVYIYDDIILSNTLIMIDSLLMSINKTQLFVFKIKRGKSNKITCLNITMEKYNLYNRS